ncbi:MAG: 4Fe-4S dicluster domain-containing protein [Bacteroides sp.]|nr:4Fe-4S dicluster domain-containing protein [Bacteroides sp.]
MLRKIRVVTATVFLLLITLLFLDFTGILHQWFGWLAKLQFIPAFLAVNIGVMVGLLFLTLLFGRVYCSVICPLGVFRDGISHLSARRKGKKNRFRHSPAVSWLRYGMLVVFIIALIAKVSILVSLLDLYAAYGRIASGLLSPLYRLGNNLLAWLAERADSYAFYTTEVWIKSYIVLAVALITLIAVAILAWRGGRTYCNTLCPVGTMLGFLSRFAIFRMTFDRNKCTRCKACERTCKASCIDAANLTIDHSRCVTCFNCIGRCKTGAMKYTSRFGKRSVNLPADKESAHTSDNIQTTDHPVQEEVQKGRRNALTLLATVAVAHTLKAQQIHVDGGLAAIEKKKIPKRNHPIVPPGAVSVRNLTAHCTACQLCVSACPNGVLRPSSELSTLMQPEMSYERGYCRPECTECSQVCPAGAIIPITPADKAGLSIGTAVWIKENCIVNRDEVQCTNCEYHCPTGAITLVDRNPGYSDSLRTPVIDKELCIGCGACENLCPARPFSAIYVEGNTRHHLI